MRVASDDLAANGLAGVADGVEGLLDGVFHHSHAPADGVFDQLHLFDDKHIDFAAGALAFLFSGAKDFLAVLPGFADDAVLGDERVSPLARELDDARGFVLRFADNPLPILDYALRLFDLVGHRHAELIDEGQKLHFLNHHAATEWHSLADANQLFKPIHQVQDVGGSVLLTLRRLALRHVPSPVIVGVLLAVPGMQG